MPGGNSYSNYGQHADKTHHIRIVILKQSQCLEYPDNREVEDINTIGEIAVFPEIIQELKGVSDVKDNDTDHHW